MITGNLSLILGNMEPIVEQLHQRFEQALLKAYPDLAVEKMSVDLAQSTQDKFGHYQYNSAMKLSKELKQPPRDIANNILLQLDTSNLIEHCEIAGPGFINITLKNEFLNLFVNQLLTDAHLGIKRPEKPLKIIIDFSSPNVAKPMHVGHLRSTIIGDSLARLFEFLGHDVLRLNHIGDWGTAFGMLIAYMEEHSPKVLEGTQSTDLSQLVTWYKESKYRFDTDADFKKRAQLKVVALQGGEKKALKAWEMICDISHQNNQQIYDLLDIKLIDRGESFYNPMLANVVAELESKGLVTLSDGAKCIFLDGFQNREGKTLPLMIQKSDGGYNYDTTDMAAIRHRVLEEKGDRLIYVTDAGQQTHFQMIFKAAEKANYITPQTRLDHVGFGLVLGADGKKLKTRSGESEALIDLLTAAIQHARDILLTRNPEMDEPTRESIAHALGLAAVKYADLSTHRMSDYQFSYDKMLKFEGNTAAFILYSYVRIEGIKRKVGTSHAIEQISLSHPSEISLALTLAQFSEALNQVAEDLLPNRLTDYLYALAEKFNVFFRDCRVEGSPEQASRLALCELTSKTLKQGLSLLGIRTIDRM